MRIFVFHNYNSRLEQSAVKEIIKAHDIARFITANGGIPVGLYDNLNAWWANSDEHKDMSIRDWMDIYCVPLFSTCDALYLDGRHKYSKCYFKQFNFIHMGQRTVLTCKKDITTFLHEGLTPEEKKRKIRNTRILRRERRKERRDAYIEEFKRKYHIP